MRFVNNAGAFVDDADVAEHQFEFVGFEAGEEAKWQSLQTAQPDAGWSEKGGTQCIAFDDISEWACATAHGAEALAGLPVWRRRFSAAASDPRGHLPCW